jgi:acyl-CoA thioesterase I
MTLFLGVYLSRSFVFLFVFLMSIAGQEFSDIRAAESGTRNVICFGDSITAGYGLENAAAESYPALLQKKLDQTRVAAESAARWRVINAGLSGETTAGGARRIDWVLRQPVDIFILALGGNDGLRGLDPAVSQRNLQTIIDRVRARYPAAKIVLAGMMMPLSMGEDYARAFATMYPTLATKNELTLVPFLLEGVGGRPELNQADAIHPNPAGNVLIAETLWRGIQPLITR